MIKPFGCFYILSLIFSLALGIACEEKSKSSSHKGGSTNGRNQSKDRDMLSGFGVDGDERRCPEVICSDDTNVSSPPADFTSRCSAKGMVVKTCACGDYICVNPSDLDQKANNKGKPGELEFTGYDMSGNQVSCTNPRTELACTAIYGPEEEFSKKCEAKGYQSYTCGCHDYLCSEKVE